MSAQAQNRPIRSEDGFERMNAQMRSLAYGAFLLIPYFVLLGWHANHYMPFLSDDALISLRYSERLLAGDGLTWTDGRPVEGYSNLLWVLATAVMGAFGMDLIVAARLLGMLCMGGIGALLLANFWPRHALRHSGLPLAVGLGFLGANATTAVWAIGGLEAPLYAVLIAAAIYLHQSLLRHHTEGQTQAFHRRTIALSIVLGMLAITRPDGFVFTIAVVAALWLASFQQGASGLRRQAFAVLPGALAFYLGQLAFRLAYYGEWVPNTALVKLTPSEHHLEQGLLYVGNILQTNLPFSGLAILAISILLFRRESRPRALLLAFIAVGWSLYLILIGGDIFPAFRHSVPLLAVFAFALVDVLIWVASLPGKVALRAVVLGVCAASIVPFVRAQMTAETSTAAIEERWEWQGKIVGEVLRDAFEDLQPTVAVTAAGCIPYWSKLPALDMLGLNDYYLPRHPPEDIGTGLLGHELGDGQYVWDQNPDLMVFHIGTAPASRSGVELLQIPGFLDRYRPARVWTRDRSSHFDMLFNQESPLIGIQRTPQKISIPSHALRGPKTFLIPDAQGRLVLSLEPQATAQAKFKADPMSGPRAWVNATIGQAIPITDRELVGVTVTQDAGSWTVDLVNHHDAPVLVTAVTLEPQ